APPTGQSAARPLRNEPFRRRRRSLLASAPSLRPNAGERHRSPPTVRTSGLLLALLASPAFSGIGLTAATLHLRLDPAASSVTFDGRVNIGINSFVGRVEAWSLDLTM